MKATILGSDRQGRKSGKQLSGFVMPFSLTEIAEKEEHEVKTDDSNIGHVECEGESHTPCERISYTVSFMKQNKEF